MNFIDRKTTNPHRVRLTEVGQTNSTVYDVEREDGPVIGGQEGTPLNADTFNDLQTELTTRINSISAELDAVNAELARMQQAEFNVGTKINIANVREPELDFTSDPQEQLDSKYSPSNPPPISSDPNNPYKLIASNVAISTAGTDVSQYLSTSEPRYIKIVSGQVRTDNPTGGKVISIAYNNNVGGSWTTQYNYFEPKHGLISVTSKGVIKTFFPYFDNDSLGWLQATTNAPIVLVAVNATAYIDIYSL